MSADGIINELWSACSALDSSHLFALAAENEKLGELLHQARRLVRVVAHGPTMGPPSAELIDALRAALAASDEHDGSANDCAFCRLARAARACIDASSATPKARAVADARARGFTGDSCPGCGGCQVRWNGTCKGCIECGWTGGCS